MTSTRQTSVSYKTLLKQAAALKGKIGREAHSLAGVLCRVFEDKDFRADLGNVDDFKAGEALGEYTEPLCLTFFELRALYIHRPDAEDWATGNLATLYAAVRQEIANSQDDEKPAAAPRRTAKVADMEKAIEEKRHAEAVAQTLEQKLAAAEERIKELELEVARLRGQLEYAESHGELAAA